MAPQSIRIFSDAFRAVWKNKRLWLLHFLLNAGIVGAAILWLKIPDASAWQLVFSATVALLLVVGALWLHAGTLAYFLEAHQTGQASLAIGFKTGRRHLLAFVLWAAIFAVCIYAVLQIPDTDAFDSWLRSSMPAFLRRHISLQAVDWVTGWAIALLLYVLVPALLLPLATQFAGRGLSLGAGLRAWRQTAGRISYWVWFAILTLLGIYVPHLIANWAPQFSSLWLENLSLVIRFVIAFGLTITAWLVLTSMLGRLGGGDGSKSVGGDAPA